MHIGAALSAGGGHTFCHAFRSRDSRLRRVRRVTRGTKEARGDLQREVPKKEKSPRRSVSRRQAGQPIGGAVAAVNSETGSSWKVRTTGLSEPGIEPRVTKLKQAPRGGSRR